SIGSNNDDVDDMIELVGDMAATSSSSVFSDTRFKSFTCVDS
ncbi:10144_t:CDS:1, partial [Paraglomus occultum]